MLPVDSAARSDLDHRIRIGRPGTPESGRPAADSPETAVLDGDLAGASRSRAPGHDLRRGKHRSEARATANSPRVARTAGTHRRRRAARGADGPRRRPPVSARGRNRARGLQCATPAASSPCDGATGRLRND
jgi:hypothetical protein